MKQVTAEAKTSKKRRDIAHLFGIKVISSNANEVLEKIVQVVRNNDYLKPFFVVTAYSEFFLEAEKNPSFKEALKKADLVVPDGVSVVAAIDFLEADRQSFLAGLGIGKKIITGGYPNRIVGVKLMETLLKLAVQNKYRVFFLGGWNGVAGRLAKKWQEKGLTAEWEEGFTNLNDISGFDSTNKLVLDKIAKFKPDLLFVSFGRFKQEIWIYQQMKNIRAKVVMGVGSAFDELAGEGPWKKATPEWVEKRGLKWLWRVRQNPGHIKRAWNAFPVFAWKVYSKKR